MESAPSHGTARIVLAVAALGVTIGLGTTAATLVPGAADEDLYSIVRGGRLYDNWYAETGETAPTKSHPVYPTDKTFANDPAANWRCNECHGWDYRGRNGAYGDSKHFTGIKGIDGMAGNDPDSIVAVLKDETHAFRKHLFPGLDGRTASQKRLIAILKERKYKERGWMSERDFRDLASFISKGQVDMARFIDGATGKAKGEIANGETYYTTICTPCHGRDGMKIKSTQPLGEITMIYPWESLHKILNGHPGIGMPPFRVLGVDVAGDILAYVQTLPKKQALASIVRGGRLYDNWIKEADKAVPERPHPAYPDSGEFANDPNASWRCKECHGWDYRGRDGAYGKGKRYTGIKGIRHMANADPARIIAVLTDDTHEYGRMLEYRDLQDLAAFVGKGQIDMDQFIDRPSRSAIGDGTKSLAFFATICATCHGMSGGKIGTMRPLGEIARRNPWESLHKILNGHPNRIMPALRVLDTPVLKNILAYIQTLPAER